MNAPRELWVWRKGGSAAALAEWREHLTDRQQSQLVLTDRAGRRAKAEMYFKSQSVASRWAERWGGRVSRLTGAWWTKGRDPARARRVGPFVVRDRASERNPAGRIEVVIPAETAFGTGAHATTWMCLEQLAAAWPFESMLDVGCGSGILAIAAARLGCRQVQGIDNDGEAVRVARRNASRNRVRVRLDCRAVGANLPKAAVVAANLFAEPLIQHGRALGAAVERGGALIVSGFREDQEEAVVGSWEWPIAARTTRSGWVCVRMNKPPLPGRVRDASSRKVGTP